MCSNLLLPHAENSHRLALFRCGDEQMKYNCREMKNSKREFKRRQRNENVVIECSEGLLGTEMPFPIQCFKFHCLWTDIEISWRKYTLRRRWREGKRSHSIGRDENMVSTFIPRKREKILSAYLPRKKFHNGY